MAGDTVSTSKLSSVTRTVCSHCADRLWSFVTIVQPSASWRMSGRPALIIGSMVDVMPAELAHYAEPALFGAALNGMTNVAQFCAWTNFNNAAPHALVSDFTQA